MSHTLRRNYDINATFLQYLYSLNIDPYDYKYVQTRPFIHWQGDVYHSFGITTKQRHMHNRRYYTLSSQFDHFYRESVTPWNKGILLKPSDALIAQVRLAETYNRSVTWKHVFSAILPKLTLTGQLNLTALNLSHLTKYFKSASCIPAESTLNIFFGSLYTHQNILLNSNQTLLYLPKNLLEKVESPRLWPPILPKEILIDQVDHFRHAYESLERTYPVILLIIGILFNILNLIILNRRPIRQIHSSTYTYLRWLAVADILSLFVGLTDKIFGAYLPRYQWSERIVWLCRLKKFFNGVGQYSATWILVAVSVDRLLWVMLMAKAKHICTEKQARCHVVLIICLFTLINLHFLFFFGCVRQPFGCHTVDAQPQMIACVPPCHLPLDHPYLIFTHNYLNWIDGVIYSYMPFILMLSSTILFARKVLLKDQRRQIRSSTRRRVKVTFIGTLLNRLYHLRHQFNKMKNNSSAIFHSPLFLPPNHRNNNSSNEKEFRQRHSDSSLTERRRLIIVCEKEKEWNHQQTLPIQRVTMEETSLSIERNTNVLQTNSITSTSIVKGVKHDLKNRISAPRLKRYQMRQICRITYSYYPYLLQQKQQVAENVELVNEVEPKIKYVYLRDIYTKLEYYYPPILLSIGLTFNLLSFIVHHKKSMRKLRSSTYTYLGLLAVIDSLALIVGLTDKILKMHFPLYHLSEKYLWACRLRKYLGVATQYIAIWTLVAVSLDRVFMVICITKSRELCTTKRARMVFSILVFVFLLIPCHFLIYYGCVEKPERCSEQTEDQFIACDIPCHISKEHPYNRFIYEIWNWIDGTLYSYLPFFIMLTCSILIVKRVLINGRKEGNKKNKYIQSTVNRRDQQKRQMSIMLFSMNVFILLCATPRFFLQLIYDQLKTSHGYIFIIFYLKVAEFFMFLIHTFNFLFYCLTNPRFRNELVDTFCQCSSCCAQFHSKPKKSLTNTQTTKVLD
ncbi:hypothetical protein SNEBB_000143 [Seison nebaliae]|nr:hypothetical protein SNEBB_000143 [Seison nebaliae]